MAKERLPYSAELFFELQNRGTTRLTEYTIDSAFMTPTDGWSVEYYEEGDELPLTRNLELQPVQLYINGNLQMIGRVDSTEIGHKGHAVKLEGRDYIADLTECHVDPTIALKKNMTLEQAVLLAASPVGIKKVVGDRTKFRNIQTGVNVVTGFGDGRFLETKLDDYKANPGEGLFAFLNRIVSRHAATIQPTESRDTLALVEPNYVQEPIGRIIRFSDNPSGTQNNVISAKARRDFSKFPTYVLVTGRQGKKGGPKEVISINSDESVTTKVVGPDNKKPPDMKSAYTYLLPDREQSLIVPRRLKPGDTHPGGGSLYRLMYMRDEQSKTENQLHTTMVRTTGERMKDTLQYTVQLRGHYDPETGATYAPDTLIEVQDEVCGIQERLWVERRTFQYTENDGPTTSLTCWRIGSFIL